MSTNSLLPSDHRRAMSPLTPTSSQEVIEVPDSSPDPAEKRRRAIFSALAEPDRGKRKGVEDDDPDAVEGNATAGPSRVKRGKTDAVSRSRETERMLNTMDSVSNPITHSTSFVHSCSTGHQQRGGDRGFYTQAREVGLAAAARENGGAAMTYWDVRTKNVEDAARRKETDIFSGCIIAINGPTGPRVSNLQLQNMITANGGRYVPHQTSRCTHVVAERLSGTKSAKYIKGQGARGAAQRTRAVKVEWILDCVEQGKRLSEAGYGSVEDPTQKSLFASLGMKPKAE